ncbi:MAG: zf-HC2 domain-containing protein, partial [Holophagales bacterium]|nr:zf-HC2 domain-containing protein [Holophagales bacterium]
PETRSRHPSLEVLGAYLEQRLDGTERDRIREHLATCGRCAADARDLEQFTAGAAPAENHPSPAQLERIWDGIERQRAPGESVADNTGRGARLTPARTLLAAVLLVGVALLLLRSSGPPSQTPPTAEPWSNPVVVDLESESFRRRSGAAAEVPRVGSGVPLVLVFHRAREVPAGSCRVEIFDPGNRSLWAGEGFLWSPEGFLTLALPPRFLASRGSYRFEVSIDTGAGWETVEVYQLGVEAPPSG